MTFPKNICSNLRSLPKAGGKTPAGNTSSPPRFSSRKQRLEPGILIFLLIIASCVLFSCGGTAAAAQTAEAPSNLVIFAASNLEPVMNDLMSAFSLSITSQSDTNVQWEIRYGSSTYLMQQILMGARADMYLSANINLPSELHRRGYGIEEPFAYTRGILCLVTTETNHGNLAFDEGLQPPAYDLRDYLDHFKNNRLYYANPELAPYGAVALNLLEKNSLVQTNVVIGENVGQTAQFLIQGGGIGFIPLSLAMEYEAEGMLSVLRVFNREEITGDTELLQGALVLVAGIAEEFALWLLEEGQEILSSKGYDRIARDLEV